MTQSSNRLGRIGEQLAVRHLQRQGVQVLARNWRVGVEGLRGEIDIVARDADVLVFCEVKARRGAELGDEALAAVTSSKQRQLRRLAGLYLARECRDGSAGSGDVRFDVVGVCWPAPGGGPRVVHVRGAF